MNEQITITTVDKEGFEEIIRRLEGLEENPQQAYNILFVSALLARNQGLSFEGYNKAMITAWEVAGAISPPVEETPETNEEETQ